MNQIQMLTREEGVQNPNISRTSLMEAPHRGAAQKKAGGRGSVAVAPFSGMAKVGWMEDGLVKIVPEGLSGLQILSGWTFLSRSLVTVAASANDLFVKTMFTGALSP